MLVIRSEAGKNLIYKEKKNLYNSSKIAQLLFQKAVVSLLLELNSEASLVTVLVTVAQNKRELLS